MKEPHLTDGEMALYVEGNVDPRQKHEFEAHLGQCARCREILEDARVVYAAHSVGSETFASTPETVTLGSAACESASGQPKTARSSRLRRNWPIGLTAAAVLSAALVALWPWTRASDPGPRLTLELTAPIQASMELASRNDALVFPGTEHSLSGSAVAYTRSGDVGMEESRDRALDALHRRFVASGMTPELSFWLIAGSVTAGKVHAAIDYARIAGVDETFDADTQVVTAIAEYRDGRIETAVERLRRVVERHPRHAIAMVNLGCLLGREGRIDESRSVLNKAKSVIPGAASPLATRIDEILDRLPR